MPFLFVGFVSLMAVVVIALIARYTGIGTALKVAIGLGIWFTYIGLLSYSGVIKNTSMRPPGVAFVFLPIVVFFIVLVRWICSSDGARVALAFPLWLVLGMQVYRVGVELFLRQLWHDGVIPRMLTFEGANVDIYIGATAPLLAWLSTGGRPGMKLALLWNVLGLLALANVVVRAILTSPGPLNLVHTEISNQMIGTFPYTFIAAFFVPLAVVLHMVSLRLIRMNPAQIGQTETS